MRSRVRSSACHVALLLATVASVACHPDEEAVSEPAVVATITTAAVARADLQERITAYGVLEPAPNDEVLVALDVESSVVRVLVKAGETVRAGQELVAVRASGASRLDAARARIELDLATQELARMESMRTRGLATNADVAQQGAARDKASAEAALFGAGADGTRTVRAPSAGLVRAVAVKAGDVVAPGGPLVVLAGAGARRVQLGIEASDVARVKVGAAVRIAPVYAPTAVLAGTVLQVHPHIDAETHEATAVVSAPPAGEVPIVDGALCRGEVVVRQETAALVVPRASVLRRGEEAWVYVVAGTGDGARAQRVTVTAVLDDGTRVAVSGALTEGAPVVVTGASELEDGMPVHVENDAADGGAP